MKKFMDLVNDYKNIQQKFKDKNKQHMEREYLIGKF